MPANHEMFSPLHTSPGGTMQKTVFNTDHVEKFVNFI